MLFSNAATSRPEIFQSGKPPFKLGGLPGDGRLTPLERHPPSLQFRDPAVQSLLSRLERFAVAKDRCHARRSILSPPPCDRLRQAKRLSCSAATVVIADFGQAMNVSRLAHKLLAAEPADALALQPPLPDDGLKIAPSGEKNQTALLSAGTAGIDV